MVEEKVLVVLVGYLHGTVLAPGLACNFLARITSTSRFPFLSLKLN